MIWKNYSHLRNTHAFLAPSRRAWINYSEDKLIESYLNHQKAALGTKLHKFAEDAINLKRRQPNTTESLNAFVNDAIGFGMSPEVVLYYSPLAYGSADAIGYENHILRIHDLKTGRSPGSIEQLMIYAALFLLDYKESPKEIYLKIYQNDEITEYDPSLEEINEIADIIVASDKLLSRLAV